MRVNWPVVIGFGASLGVFGGLYYAARHVNIPAGPTVQQPPPQATPTPAPTTAVVPAVATAVDDPTKDASVLLEDVHEIAAPGQPGPLCLFGEQAQAIVVGKSDEQNFEPVVATARLGKGRVVAFGHADYLDPATLDIADTRQLLFNAISWAGRSPGAIKLQVAGSQSLADAVARGGFVVSPFAADELKSVQVLVLPVGQLTEREIGMIALFVEAGGGLVVAATGADWLRSKSRADQATEFAGNRLLAPAGIVWTASKLRRTGPREFATTVPVPNLAYAAKALEAGVAHVNGQPLAAADLAQVTVTLMRAAESLPLIDLPFLEHWKTLASEPKNRLLPTAKTRVKDNNPAGRALAKLQMREIRSLPPERLTAHPGAAAFPGAVPAAAPRLADQKLTIDTRVSDWHSTGLYAAPGEVVTVAVTPEVAGRGLGIRIGAHSDRNWHHDSWSRFPEISRTFAVEQPTLKVASLFGGLIYVTVPRNCTLGDVAVQISGAVAAPRYVAGVTSLADWRQRVRQLPGPWAEFESKKVIVTVPATVARDLDDPAALMQTWDRILDLCADLAQRPLDRDRPERVVTDEQISAGYMHSGYPIMTFLDQIKNFTSADALRSGNWGIFHELGHNHQSGDWTFGGTGEVTCNLFSLYIMENLCGKRLGGHGAVTRGDRVRRTASYFSNGHDFEKWKSDPFLGLEMYMQLIERFGWDTYKKVFAEYRALPPDQRPRNDDEKRDQWLVRVSRTTGKNLGPFFKAWRIPVSDKALATIAHLPVWLPADFPPRSAKTTS